MGLENLMKIFQPAQLARSVPPDLPVNLVPLAEMANLAHRVLKEHLASQETLRL